MSEISKKVAIVTGASRGIGAAIARRLASDGLLVVVNFARSRDSADALVREIEGSGGRALAVQADIGAPGSMKALFDAAETAFGGVDVLVNNAGIMKLSPIAGVRDEDFDRQVAVNFGGVFRGMREAANRLRDGGRIVNFSTSVVGMKLPTYGVYASIKAAVETMTSILAKELGPRGISVNTVAPGPVETELFLTGKTDEQVAALAGMTPFKRLGQPEDIAGVVAFLAGPDGGWVNGQTIRANGGIA
ncbi:SDR family oxidoreductase [Jiella avicenniae]|uniref:SDR family oxidoreductase n=1 Tax=Jiella avicenniae TaxID=2907202 RepID=A0A9X1P132_9HYPH|nr:SDR family oxidoreductase [Jiella avicenniae]MCE7028583.1 SDR family oxidoreductase [Jiella avicenniae]